MLLGIFVSLNFIAAPVVFMVECHLRLTRAIIDDFRMIKSHDYVAVVMHGRECRMCNILLCSGKVEIYG